MDISTYHDDPLRFTKERLCNWGRWTRRGLGPNLGYPPCVPWARGWIPAHGWDLGWGDQGAPLPPPMPVDHRDADRVDGALRQLCGSEHFIVLKRHYAKDLRQQREDLDRAIRALLHILTC